MTGKLVTSFLEEDGGFPDDNIFNTLLQNAREVDQVIFHDSTTGINASYSQFITDVIHMRHQLRERFSQHLNPQSSSVFTDPLLICTLAHANYEYAVATFAILALGGVPVPLPTNTTPELLLHHLRRSPVKFILVGSDFHEQAREYQRFCGQNFLPAIDVQPISTMNDCPGGLLKLPSLSISNSGTRITIAESRPGIILFSSGSTGTPKGIIHNRGIFYDRPRLSSDDGLLIHRPASWLGGTEPLFSAILGGARAEIINSAAPMQQFWERFRTDNITTLTTSVVLWEKLATHYKKHLAAHPNKNEYLSGLRNIRPARIGASVPIPSLLKFYREELSMPLDIAYGSTEIGKLPFGMSAEEEATMEEHRGIGRPLFPDDHPAKLSNGDSGELLIGGVTTLIGYLHDEAAINSVIDEEGFLHTGDLCHKVGEYYFFDGRASADFIKTPGGPVPVCQLEEFVRKLHYFTEAYVVPVEDKLVGRRVGVLAQPSAEAVNLERLRSDLASMVLPHMLPTAFRPLKPDESVPLTYTDKISKMGIMKEFFSCDVDGRLPTAVELIDLGFQ